MIARIASSAPSGGSQAMHSRHTLPGPAQDSKLRKLAEEFVTEMFGLAPGETSTNARFADDLGVDSFDLLELAMEARSRFGVEISNEVLKDVQTVGDFCRCVIAAWPVRSQP